MIGNFFAYKTPSSRHLPNRIYIASSTTITTIESSRSGCFNFRPISGYSRNIWTQAALPVRVCFGANASKCLFFMFAFTSILIVQLAHQHNLIIFFQWKQNWKILPLSIWCTGNRTKQMDNWLKWPNEWPQWPSFDIGIYLSVYGVFFFCYFCVHFGGVCLT